MKPGFVAAGLILGLGLGLRAQVTDTTVCDVVKKPAAFDGKAVRIKGTVVAGLDEFIVKDSADPNCGYPVDGIWLAYPQGSKGKAGAAAIVEVQPANNFSGKYTPPARTAVTLDKGKDFKQFDSLLAQPHQKGADMCLGCTRYEVTATLTGRLDSVANASLKYDSAGKIVSFGGFGNMNAYPARLVLQSVADVTPKEVDYSKTDAETRSSQIQEPTIATNDIYSVIAAAQNSAGSLAAGQAKDQIVKATGVYGKMGEHTGVNVSLGAANEATPKDEALGTKDSPDGVFFNVTFNTDRLPGDALTRAVVHIGEHIVDLRTPEPGNADVPAYVLESNGWVITAIDSVFNGQKFLTAPGGYLLWDSNWPGADRQGRMDAAIKDFLANEAQLGK